MLKLQVSSPNVTIGVSSVGLEVREPLKVDSTTGAVNEWRVLS
jgi:hypothetical protein